MASKSQVVIKEVKALVVEFGANKLTDIDTTIRNFLRKQSALTDSKAYYPFQDLTDGSAVRLSILLRREQRSLIVGSYVLGIAATIVEWSGYRVVEWCI